MTTPASWVNCCPDIIDASIGIGSAGEGSGEERIRRSSCAIRHTGGEERPVRLHCGEESAGQIRDGAAGRVAIERTEGSVELLEGLNTEPRHDDGFRGYRGRKVRFDGLGTSATGALRLRLLQNEPFSERQTQQSSERVLPKPSPDRFL